MASLDGVIPALVGAAGSGAAAGYEIERSLRFNPGDSGYLDRNFSSTGDRRTFTYSYWVKESGKGSSPSNNPHVLWSGPDVNTRGGIVHRGTGSDAGELYIFNQVSGTTNCQVWTNSLHRDFSAWKHIVWAIDTTQSTATDRVKVYINGVQETLNFATTPAQNLELQINLNQEHRIGRGNTDDYGNFYLTEVHFIDGQALAATDFGEYDDNNVWQPKAYSGSYGTNGFHLPFSDNSTAAALGTDTSGNGNDWTVNNLVAEQPTSLPGVFFDGSGDYLSVGNSADYNFTGDFTAEAWVYVNAYTNDYAGIFGFSHDGDQQGWNVLLRTSGRAHINVDMNYTDVTGTLPLKKWTHIALVRSGSGSGNVKFYINGVADSTTLTETDETGTISSAQCMIGNYPGITSRAFNGVISNVRLVKGTALYTSNFTPPTAPLANVTNTKLLCCQSSSSATAATVAPGTITANGDAFATQLSDSTSANDSLVDSPTNGDQEDTGVGGEVVGNYATLNPLSLRPGATLSNGNLDISCTPQGGNWYSQGSTMGASSGNYYWEVNVVSGLSAAVHTSLGIASFDTNLSGYHYPGYTAFSYGYAQNGNKVNNTISSSYGAAYTNGDVIGFALNMSTGALVFYKNGTSQGTAFTVDTSKTYQLIIGYAGDPPNKLFSVNFGQRPFAYTAPSGYKALCTTNLPDPTIADGSTAMDATTYTGAGGTQTISGINHSPDFVWIKSRSIADQHCLFDTVRGTLARLQSNSTNAEATINQYGSLTAFNSDGFTLTAGSSSSDQTHGNNNTYVGWTWDAGTSTVSNTDGSITSSVRANASAGFSIIKVTVSGSGTIGHGLNAKPHMVFRKRTNGTSDWYVAVDTGSVEGYLLLNSTAAITSESQGLTSSVFTAAWLGNSGEEWINYAFAPVEGYSAFGSYTGNGSADGPFIYTGFRPRFILVKITSSADDWTTIDSERIGYNDDNYWLYASSSSAEYSGSFSASDILSNGFKPRSTGNQFNANGQTYIYAAFAEHPFKTARAR